VSFAVNFVQPSTEFLPQRTQRVRKGRKVSMSKKQISNKALLIGLIVSMILWGLSWPSGKVLTSYMSAFDFAMIRYIIVVLTLLPILIFLKVPLTGQRKGVPYVLAAGILLTLYSFLFYQGLKHGLAGAGGVLVTTLNPIIAYSLVILINKKIPSGNERVGLLLGLIAGCILLKIWNRSELFESGNLYFLAASFTWALMSRFTSKASFFGSSLSFSLWQYLVTIIFILPFIRFDEFKTIFSITDSIFWLNLFFSSAIVTTLATTLYFYATTILGAERASSFIFLVPFAAEIFSWLLLKESMLIHTIVGGILGIVAVYIINSKRKPGLN